MSVRLRVLLASCLLCLPTGTRAQAVDGMDSVPCAQEVASLASCYVASLPSGAFVMAVMPNAWNGDLVVYAHGGPSLFPPTVSAATTGNERYVQVAATAGYAWIGSTYRREGYGAQFAADDVEESRIFFLEHFPKPRHTFLFGTSYGALVSTMLLEKHVVPGSDGAQTYDGAVLNSGVVAGAFAAYEFRVDLRVVYQFYCANLPRPGESSYPAWQGLPPGSTMTQAEVSARINECTGVELPRQMRTRQQARRLADIISVVGIPEGMLPRHMQAGTFVLRDIVDRITNGLSPYSNSGVQYRGSSNDAVLNAGVERFAADPAAVAALAADGLSEGRLPVPVVSIHSINDPQVPVEVQREFQVRVERAGRSGQLMQAYTDEASHAQQSAAELGAALAVLARWVESGERPTPASAAESCERLRATLDGPCRWQLRFEPNSLNTRFARAVKR